MQAQTQAEADVDPSWRDVMLGIPGVAPARWHRLHPLKRWLIASRAMVLPLTLFAVTFAVCIAPPPSISGWLLAGAVLVALLLAHATNNLLNDYVDHGAGLDRGNYARAQYGVHVLESGLMSKAALRRYILWTGIPALLLALFICWISAVEASIYAGAGALLVLFYTYPLKRMALGDLAVFAAWGPLMIAGTAVVVTGSADMSIAAAGAVYGLGPTLVICAKHRDKLEDDRTRDVYTVPVLLGDRHTGSLLTALALLQVAGVIWLAVDSRLYGLLLSLAALPQLFRVIAVYRAGTPPEKPADFPAAAWPLWFTSHSFLYARNTGLLMTAGVCGQRLLF